MTDKKNIQERVISVLDRVRPYLQSDGGDVDLIEITDDMTVYYHHHRRYSNVSSSNHEFCILVSYMEISVRILTINYHKS